MIFEQRTEGSQGVSHEDIRVTISYPGCDKRKEAVWQEHREQVTEEDEAEVAGAYTPRSCWPQRGLWVLI